VISYEAEGQQYVAAMSGVVSGFFGGSGTSAVVVFGLAPGGDRPHVGKQDRQVQEALIAPRHPGIQSCRKRAPDRERSGDAGLGDRLAGAEPDGR